MSVARLAAPGLVAVVLLAALTPAPLAADENLLGYVYGAETLPRGKWEAYQWATARLGKASGSYAGYDLRTEVETGLTDKLQAALYVNSRAHRIHGVEELEDRSSFQLQGASAEFKYRLKSPYLDGYGLAFYVEPGYNRVEKVAGEVEEEFELETKVIFQKNFLEDTLVWSVNYTLEPEWAIGADDEHEEEGEPGGTAEVAEARRALGEELATGVSYRLAPRWFAGAELRAHSEWPDFSRREHTAVFLGPNLHYGGERWWWTLAVMPQVWGWPDGEVPGLQLDEHERLEVRLKLGYSFR